MFFTAADVREVLDRLDAVGVDAWLDGGWAVDALVGEQSRPHADLDLIVQVAEVALMREALGPDGFDLVEGVPDSNFILRDGRARSIDVHPVRFDPQGNGVYRMENGEDWIYPAAGFGGRGTVGGRDVRCLTADVQMLCHAGGYVPGATDFHDMALLHDLFGTRLLPPFDVPEPGA